MLLLLGLPGFNQMNDNQTAMMNDLVKGRKPKVLILQVTGEIN